MGEINISGLTRDYGNNKGIFDLNLTVNPGEVFGYLGPNGAGKTTTIRHLMGFLHSPEGTCTIDGLDCIKHSEEIHRDLGYISGEIGFFDNMTGSSFLRFMGKMRGMKDDSRMNQLLEYFELDSKCKIKKMSKGMKQKLAIVSAFMHNPSTLILDEPTSGLDPLMQNKFVNLILKEKENGKTILMSSHSFEEVEKTCDRVGIIRSGRLVANESVENLMRSKRKLYTVAFRHTPDVESFIRENLDIVCSDEKTVTVAVSGDIAGFISAMSRHPVLGLDSISMNIEDIFMSYYGGENNA